MLGYFDVFNAVAAATMVSLNSYADKHYYSKKESEKEFTVENSRRVEQECERLSSNNHDAKLLYLAAKEETKKWIDWAILYMTQPSVKLAKASDDEKKFINGIGEYVGYGKIYREVDSFDVTKFDAKKLEVGAHPKFILSVDDLEDLKANQYFVEKWKKCLESRSGITIEKVVGEVVVEDNQQLKTEPAPEDKIINVEIVEDPTEPAGTVINTKKPKDMSDEVFEKYEDAFASLLTNYEYYYEIDEHDGTWLCINRFDGAMTTRHMVDAGSIMGGTDVAILASYQTPDYMTDTIFVKVKKHQDIAKNIIDSPLYVMGPEAQEIFKDYFNNSLIYHYIDFTDTEWIDDISDENKALLEKFLVAALNVFNLDMRLKFEEYIDPCTFTLTNQGAKSQMPFCNTTAQVVSNIEASIEVTEKKMVKRIGADVEEYNVKHDAQ